MPIRQPTPQHVLYAWWVAAMDGKNPPVHDTPHCGWFKVRIAPRYSNGALIKDAPLVPARIWMHQVTDEIGELTEPEVLLCEVNGRPKDPLEQWLYLCKRPISREEYRHLMALGKWAREYEPESPLAKPDQGVNWNDEPINL